MAEWISTLAPHWFWLTLGLVLGTAEILVPGFFLIWLAGAAMVVGIVMLVLPLPIAAQVGLFAILSVVFVYGAKRWLVRNPIESIDPKLNNRSARLVGEIVTVVEAIANNNGRVKVGDSVWSVSGPDAGIGTQVRITGGDGSRLIVEPL
jgi:inner membrane protein